MLESSVSRKLNAKERTEVAALLDAFWPALSESEARRLLDEEKIEDVDSHVQGLMASGSACRAAYDAIETALDGVLDAEAHELQLVLRLLGTGYGTWILTGFWGPWSSLCLDARQKALLDMAASRFMTRRKAYNALKRLLLACLATAKNNPVAAAAGYKSRDWSNTPAAEDLVLNAKAQEDTDIIIVGSGCGGSVMACKLATAGYKVLLLEKGGAPKYAEFNGDEKNGFALYERAGLAVSIDGSIAVLAGNTLGGGSTVNWGCSLRTPRHVQAEWGFDWCRPGGRLDKALDAVETRLSVNTESIKHNAANAALMSGAQALGLEPKATPQNFKNAGTDACSLCAYGDRFANKQAMPTTFLKDAINTGNCRILPNTQVKYILRDPASGRAHGVRCFSGPTIHARKAVVVSAGSLHTPCILLRSKIPNCNIGYNLKLHPVTACCALMPSKLSTPTDGLPLLDRDQPDISQTRFQTLLRGAPMTSVCRAGPDPYEALIEVPHCGLGLAFAAVPWSGGLQAKRLALRAKRLATFIVLQRDSGRGGRILLDQKTGQPLIEYRLSTVDQSSMNRALCTCAKIWAKVGAKKIWTAHLANPIKWKPGDNINSFEQAVLERKLGANYASLFSAHQMGTCRMGTDPRTSVVDDRGQSWEMPSLYIADASVFPTASGVNPMLTVLSISFVIADNILQDLQSPSPKDHHIRARRWQSQAAKRQATLLILRAASCASVILISTYVLTSCHEVLR